MPHAALDAALRPALNERRARALYRRRRTLASPQQPELVVDGQPRVGFCSNDYLGLANHPAVVTAFRNAAGRYGVGSGASHLVCGHSAEHHALEEELADFLGRERALLFSTGYMANLGAVTALVGKGDAIFEDRLNHASLLDAGLLSGARFQRFLHNDPHHLKRRLEKTTAHRQLVAVDGVFSMDGDIAPLSELSRVAHEHSAWLMVDDAHGFGCLGETGAGTLEHLGVTEAEVPIYMGTLGKALGTAGAFVAGSDALIETLIQFSRSYIYTTALPPAVAAATRASLKLVREEGWRRTVLQERIAQFRQGARQHGLNLMASDTAIQPIWVGEDERALALANALETRGIWVAAIRPPTVPPGSARLRITLSAAHSESQVTQLLAALADSKAEVDRLDSNRSGADVGTDEVTP